jgi:hypothetical protein
MIRRSPESPPAPALFPGSARAPAGIRRRRCRRRRRWSSRGRAPRGSSQAEPRRPGTPRRAVTRPLRTLHRATTQLAEGHLADPPDATTGPPELRELAASFTHTATRLQQLLDAQQAFAGEASHQLKTPLTALRLRLENLEPYLDQRAHASLDETIQEVERLSRMVHGLLALARRENTPTTPEPTDLDAVLAERAAMWELLAAEQHVALAVTGTAAGPVWAIPGGLEQIIDNLVANALRVSPTGTTLTLTRAPGAELHVIDQGSGMTAADRERAFDRFWRASDSHHDGTGLGLPHSAPPGPRLRRPDHPARRARRRPGRPCPPPTRATGKPVWPAAARRERIVSISTSSDSALTSRTITSTTTSATQASNSPATTPSSRSPHQTPVTTPPRQEAGADSSPRSSPSWPRSKT